MPNFSNTWIVILIAVVAFFIAARVLKFEKGAAVVVLGIIVLWLALHFTGYDEKVYNFILNNPGIQSAQPKNIIPR